MRSVTSCFNSALYRKAMGRFWPLWTLYGLIWMFAIPLSFLTQYFNTLRWNNTALEAQETLASLALDLPQLLSAGVWVAGIFGVLSAMAVFGYLYNNRSACMIHALPPRREALFFTNYCTGLSILVLPQLVVALLTLVIELTLLPSAMWGTALPSLATWVLVQCAVSLFFFSFATFCAMFTGHSLALPAFYGIFNALVLSVYSLITMLMNQFFYGFITTQFDTPLVIYSTPLYALSSACRWTITDVSPAGPNQNTYLWQVASPATIACYAVAGLVFAALALLVYRQRHVESAGDVVAIPLVRPLFSWGVSFCSGLCLGIFTAAFFSWGGNPLPLTLCVIFWAAVGWFVAEMLLKKSFRVLHAWKGCAVMCAAILLLCASCFLDLFGVVARVPKLDQVASITADGRLGYPSDSGAGNWKEISDPSQMAKFIALHQAIVDDRDRANYDSSSYVPGDDTIYFYLDYTLKDGSTITRQYASVPIFQDEIAQEGSVTWSANQIIQDRALVEHSFRFDEYERGRLNEAWLDGAYIIEKGYVDTQYLDGAAGEDLRNLWQAMRQDFADGTLGMRYLFEDPQRLENTYRTDLYFSWVMPTEDNGQDYMNMDTYNQTLGITLTPQATRTLAWLREMAAMGVQFELATHQNAPATGSYEVPAAASYEMGDSSPDVTTAFLVP